MAGKKILAVKFDRINKNQIRGKKGHTRTGACPSKGKCYHGWIRRSQ